MLKVETENFLITYSNIGVLTLNEKSRQFYTIIGIYNFSEEKLINFCNSLDNIRYEVTLGPISIKYVDETNRYIVKVKNFVNISKKIDYSLE